MRANKLESLLVILLLIFSLVAGQENSIRYGAPNFSSSSSSSGGGFPEPSGPSGSGRVVGNSILQDVGANSDNLQGFRQRQQQPSFRPTTPGPRIAQGQNDIESNVGSRENISDGRRNQFPIRRGNSQQHKIFRYVSVHVAPQEPLIQRPRTTQPPPKPDMHYQIVFIKAPSPVSQLQELELPPPAETKTLVYVLMKRPDMRDLVKISQRPTKRPHKPEVYFIRYKQGSQQEQNQSNRTTPQPLPRDRPQQTTESGENVSNSGGGYETADSDSDYNYDAINDNEYLLSNNNYQRALPEFSYTPTIYGMSK